MIDPRTSMPLGFLSLGPVTSESFPKAQEAKKAGRAAGARRSSSLSSDGSKALAPGFKVLKVAPVHYGQHAGDHQQDWHDMPTVEEEWVPVGFLSLGPVTSASFPKAKQARQPAGAPPKRRSSSLSSDGRAASGFRVLKVAPVHYGEHAGDHQEDWHDAGAVVE